jgi:hypothetical protein
MTIAEWQGLLLTRRFYFPLSHQSTILREIRCFSSCSSACKALTSAGDADARDAAHLSLLNALDALETMIRRRK